MQHNNTGKFNLSFLLSDALITIERKTRKKCHNVLQFYIPSRNKLVHELGWGTPSVKYRHTITLTRKQRKPWLLIYTKIHRVESEENNNNLTTVEHQVLFKQRWFSRGKRWLSGTRQFRLFGGTDFWWSFRNEVRCGRSFCEDWKVWRASQITFDRSIYRVELYMKDDLHL